MTKGKVARFLWQKQRSLYLYLKDFELIDRVLEDYAQNGKTDIIWSHCKGQMVYIESEAHMKLNV